MKSNLLITTLFCLVIGEAFGQGKTLTFIVKDTNSRFYYDMYGTDSPVRDTQKIAFSKPNKEGFSQVNGSAMVRFMFGDKLIKITDSAILYKLPDSTQTFTFLDCRLAKKYDSFDTRIYHSYYARSHYDKRIGTVTSVAYNSFDNPVHNWCGKKTVVYEFEVYDEAADNPALIGFSPILGIVYLGLSKPMLKGECIWERICE